MEGFVPFVAMKGMDRKNKWVPYFEKADYGDRKTYVWGLSI